MHAEVRSPALMRWAGFVAAVGGGLWAAKGTAILLTGDQPEYIFEVAPLFFALGLVGLHAGLRGRGGRSARVGGTLAWGGVALSVSSAAYYVATTDDEGFPLAATIPLTALSILAGLVLLGLAVRQADALSERWRSLPLAMGAGAVPLLMVGGILETLSERLLEIPIVVFGLAWIVLGYAIWSHAPRSPGPQRPTEASARASDNHHEARRSLSEYVPRPRPAQSRACRPVRRWFRSGRAPVASRRDREPRRTLGFAAAAVVRSRPAW